MAHMNTLRGAATFLFTLGALNGISTAQSLDDTIVGCSVVGCPASETNSTANDCRVVDKNFTVIGVSRIPVNASSELSGLTWVQGVTTEDSEDERLFEKTFYLGTPADVDIGDVGACALFFTDTKSVAFNGTNDAESQGTCQEAMTESCVSALTARAKDIDYDDLTVDEACSKLKEEFEDNLDSACKPFAGSNSWPGLSVKALSGSSESPITTKKNGSSNCWPILPKSDNLNIVASFESNGNTTAESTTRNLFEITPILTVFFPGNGTLISKVDSQMSCMKSLGESVESEKTKDEGGEDAEHDAGEGGAMSLGGGITIKMLRAGLLGLLFLL
ncbi:hypothetical protein B0J13DRAFT_608645 [Dactylonectria estremocensis]|uniref:Uncharacterized protein n=1 Tax=Dactylonectria estremocensis TaxID=1079267 RepID=A0A9P9EL75_9HYPO|nr:hypothetical protein B0J13DRAFT_608645 [Dactylonectria estremocensis]